MLGALLIYTWSNHPVLMFNNVLKFYFVIFSHAD